MKMAKEAKETNFNLPTQKYNYLTIGGGVSAGYWAEELVKLLGVTPDSEVKPRIGIISSYPYGLAPYERPALSKGCLDPEKSQLRNFLDGSLDVPVAFPWTSLGAGRSARESKWYAEHGIDLISRSCAIGVDFDRHLVNVEQEVEEDFTSKVTAARPHKKRFTVQYGQLLIATGVRARRLPGTPSPPPIPSFGSLHPDLIINESSGGLKVANTSAFGFGSVHTVRDLGDCVELVAAMQRVENDSQETCKDPVIVVGSGFIAFEVAAALSRHCPDHGVLMILGSEYVFEGFFTKEMALFYETTYVRQGVRFARGYRAERLWLPGETGEFVTVDGPGINLQRSLPRGFGPVPTEFTRCRGLVLKHQSSGAEVRVQGRYVVLGLGSTPNSELFDSHVAFAPDSSILVDEFCRTSHASGQVYAAGDVAHCPMPEGFSQRRDEHVSKARSMGQYVAQCMVAHTNGANVAPFNTLPHCYSRVLSLSWVFYGFFVGEVIVLGLDEAPETGRFGAFWVNDKHIIGAFLEGGKPAEIETLRWIVEERVEIRNINMLRRQKLEDFLENPMFLAPTNLGVGDFAAETHEHIVAEVFDLYKIEAAESQVKVESLAEIMQELGADWNETELAAAIKSMDPAGSGLVSYFTFRDWWMN